MQWQLFVLSWKSMWFESGEAGVMGSLVGVSINILSVILLYWRNLLFLFQPYVWQWRLALWRNCAMNPQHFLNKNVSSMS